MAAQRRPSCVPFEHRKVHDPQRLPAGRNQATVLPHFQAQRTERIADDAALIGAEENQVTVGGSAAREDALERRIARGI